MSLNPRVPLPIAFGGNPLNRHSELRPQPAWIEEQLANNASLVLPFFKGDVLVIDGQAGFLSIEARAEFSSQCPVYFLGRGSKGQAYFALDASQTADTPETAPFADIGQYINLRAAAGQFSPGDLAIAGQARWLIDWHRRHEFCANCGVKSRSADGGAKRICPSCSTDHFPRTDPVAIVLAIHEGACLLGRGPHFPPGFLSALAGFVEPGETMEECAVREVFEEAGVAIHSVVYQFSQPWPFPNSLMMGFLAEADDRALTLDPTEIEEARWIDKSQIVDALEGRQTDGFFIPPEMTIAHQLLKRWALG